MLQKLFQIVFGVLCLVSSAQAAEIRFNFHLDLPRGLPSEFRFLYGLEPLYEKELKADVEIPGLPVVPAQRMVYVVYAQPKPNGWESVVVNWYSRDDCSIMDIHVAVRDKSDQLTVLYNELYQLGFRRAVMRAGVDLCSMEKGRRPIPFQYAGRQWTSDQLEEAVSEIGTIRAAIKLGQPQLIPARFLELMKISDFEQYELIRFLVRRSRNNPKKYEAEVGLALKSYLVQYVKK